MPDPTDLPLHPPSDNTATPEAAAQPAAEATPAPMPEAAVQAAPEVHEAQAAGAPLDASDDDTDDTPATPAAPGAPALPQLNPAACAELLRQHFPALFAGPAKPFKLRIQQDIQQRAPGVFSKGSLSAFFRRHTGSTAYLIALSKATHRFDLDGQPAGELSDEHKQLAQAELVRRRALTREREQQAHAQQREQQREAQRAEMAQQAEANQARQARAALLRDFQRTTLTLANFCALKGMAPELLNPLLEQARKEAAEAPPMPQRPPFDERRGPGPRRDDRPGGRPDGRGGPAGGPNAGPNSGPGAPRPDARGPRRDDRRPPRPGGAAGPRGPRGPRGSGGAGDAGGSGGPGGPTGQS